MKWENWRKKGLSVCLSLTLSLTACQGSDQKVSQLVQTGNTIVQLIDPTKITTATNPSNETKFNCPDGSIRLTPCTSSPPTVPPSTPSSPLPLVQPVSSPATPLPTDQSKTPGEVVKIWNNALYDKNITLAQKYTSRTYAGSLSSLASNYNKANKAEVQVNDENIVEDTACVKYTANYINGSSSPWSDTLFLEEGVWKLAPQHVSSCR